MQPSSHQPTKRYRCQAPDIFDRLEEIAHEGAGACERYQPPSFTTVAHRPHVLRHDLGHLQAAVRMSPGGQRRTAAPVNPPGNFFGAISEHAGSCSCEMIVAQTQQPRLVDHANRTF
jgi:hypothetical protein